MSFEKLKILGASPVVINMQLFSFCSTAGLVAYFFSTATPSFRSRRMTFKKRGKKFGMSLVVINTQIFSFCSQQPSLWPEAWN
jgi:hypothetical protein